MNRLLLLLLLSTLFCSCKAEESEKPKGDPVYNERTAKEWMTDLNSPTKDKRESAAYALGEIGTKAGPKLVTEIVVQLHAILKDKRSDVRCEAIRALGKIGERSPSALSNDTISEIAMGIYDQRDDVREQSAKSLGQIGAKAAPHCDVLFRGMNDSDDDVREESVESLGHLLKFADEKKFKKGVTLLIEILGDKDRSVVRNAIGALENLGEKAVPALISAVETQRPSIQTRAIDILGEIGPKAKAAIPTLKIALQNPATKDAAGEALKKIQ